MDYNSLILDIQEEVNRADARFIQRIPKLITRAINRIYSEAKSLGFEIVKNERLIPNIGLLAKFADWKETISLSIIANGEYKLLLPRSYEFCITYSPSGATGVPTFYSDQGYDAFNLFPIPDLNYFYVIIYRGLPLFDATHPMNFLTQRYPNLLFYACMMEAIPYLKDDERVPVYESMYNRELQNINRDKQITITDRTSKRDAN